MKHTSLVDLIKRRSRTGRKGPYAGYYVQIQPGGSFVGTSFPNLYDPHSSFTNTAPCLSYSEIQ